MIIAESLKNGDAEVEQGSGQIQTSGEMIDKVNSAVTEMVNSIKTVSSNLSDSTVSAWSMTDCVEEIALVAEEAAAGGKETADSTQQSSATMEEVAAGSRQLAILAEVMNG
ncbi:hypothetical protein ACH0BF_15210 [Pseudobacillus sp. 179-B 2D1 NHS]|uniref:hypothetical protein n=1 Tax=Pseudobacillus sp. 179-B 2D1 NHS TaxID=3374292 RepID=UPI0038798708